MAWFYCVPFTKIEDAPHSRTTLTQLVVEVLRRHWRGPDGYSGGFAFQSDSSYEDIHADLVRVVDPKVYRVQLTQQGRDFELEEGIGLPQGSTCWYELPQWKNHLPISMIGT